jgi:hypothetical protein
MIALRALLVLIVLAVAAGPVAADPAIIPDFSLSAVTIGCTDATLLVSPAGRGPALDAIGCTITVQLLDATGSPVSGYPAQDVWVDDVGNGDLYLCPGAARADAPSDGDGFTTFTGRLAMGGWTQEGLQVYVAGQAIAVPLPLDVNGPDITRDGTVDVADLGEFTVDFVAGAPVFRSDLVADGSMDIADLGAFAIHFGDECF